MATAVLVVLAGVAASGALSSFSLENLQKSKATSASYPSRRWGPNMVYDAKDGYVLMFSGSSGGNATWSYSNGRWTNLDIAAAPPARAHAGIAYDAADGYVVLFGGAGAHRTFNDTWEYSGGVWKNVTATAGPAPPPMVAMGMSYDAADGYIVLFGGLTATHKTLNATWEFAGGKWTNVTATVGPAPMGRFAEGLAYDAADGYVLMYGGWTDVKGLKDKTLEDTWKFSGGRWTELSSLSAPGPRWFVGLTYDSADGYILLFEGINDSGMKSNWNTPADTWTYQGGVWTNVTNPSDTPSHRFAEGLVDDPAGNNVLLFGGLNSTAVVAHTLSDTWTYAAGVWTNVTKTA